MLKTQKFLYILPELTYVVEFVEDKQSGRFFIHSFRQINGQFMDENILFIESLKKLFQKLDEDNYYLILPDFVFTDTIVNIPESDDEKIAQYLKENLLPNIGVSDHTHQIQTSILMQRSDVSKIQISALEKNFIAPLYKAIGSKNINILNISPLNWTVKTLISLEPSISILQLGNRLYLAEHYIGINQTNYCLIEESENLIETIKTIKGAEPNIQTVYLLTNILIENKIKQALSKIIPIQQLVNNSDSSQQIPNYVKEIIEAGARTFALEDFPLPLFSFIKNEMIHFSPEDEPEPKIKNDDLVDNNDQNDFKTQVSKVEILNEDLDEEPNHENFHQEKKIDDEKEQFTNQDLKIVENKKTANFRSFDINANQTSSFHKSKSITETKDLVANNSEINKNANVDSHFTNNDVEDETEKNFDLSIEEKNDPLSKFARQKNNNPKSRLNDNYLENSSSKSKRVMKAIFTFFAVTIGVIIVGVLFSAIILKLLGSEIPFNLNFLFLKKEKIENINEEIKVESETLIATNEAEIKVATKEAEAKKEIDKTKLKVLVINATDIAGHAGKTKTILEKAGFKNIAVGNAKESYGEEIYLLLKVDNDDLSALLEKTLDSKLTSNKNITKETSTANYDIVIVLGK